MMSPIRERSIVTCILLSLVTCGIYGIIWFVSITDDMKIASGDQSLPSGGMAFLLTLVTCGIYGFFWAWKMGKANTMAKNSRGLPAEDSSVLYLILQVLGLGIVVYCLVQNDLNEMSKLVPNQQNNFPNQNMGV